MDDLDEPRVLDALQGWIDAQVLLRGVPDVTTQPVQTTVGWYDTGVDDREGAFCLIDNGGALEDLVGDVVQVTVEDVTIWVYCLGGAALDQPIALARTAFSKVAMLSEESVDALVQRSTRAS